MTMPLMSTLQARIETAVNKAERLQQIRVALFRLFLTSLGLVELLTQIALISTATSAASCTTTPV